MAIVAFLIDSVAVYFRQQKSIFNEFLTFAAVCLSTPFAYGATSGHWDYQVWGL
ncbi:MAG: hypothetical protein NZ901_02540 [Geminocystis sp.]|nr:hypothetical protein [Geminocystis sp.]MCS7147049.1 hypothetical protein [Geminocystis sp.]MCX8079303.1 hypothetical protein [Geminocystis sp.]MDW8115872.1 hypothetical protein [Geminocystis sp.]MDW8463413.1 hypothetical protein [Geminocystis sp.]